MIEFLNKWNKGEKTKIAFQFVKVCVSVGW